MIEYICIYRPRFLRARKVRKGTGKMKIKKILCIFAALMMAVSLLFSCNRDSGLSETLAAPDDKWQDVSVGEPVSEMPDAERDALILSIIGEDEIADSASSELADIFRPMGIFKKTL